MVNIVGTTDSVRKTEEIVDGSEDVLNGDVLGTECIKVILDSLSYSLFTLIVFQDFLQNGEHNVLLDAVFCNVKVNEILDVNHTVGNNLDLNAVAFIFHNVEINLADTLLLEFLCLFAGDGLTCFNKHLAGHRINNRTACYLARNTCSDSELLVVLETSYAREVITAVVKEQLLDMALSTLNGCRLAGTELFIYFNKS